jgi:hypothetical protein
MNCGDINLKLWKKERRIDRKGTRRLIESRRNIASYKSFFNHQLQTI